MKRFLLLTFLLSSTFVRAEELRVSVAPQFKDQIIELSNLFGQKNPEWKVIVASGPAADIAKQIETDAPIDVFIGNDPETLERLKEKNLITANSITTLLYDDLVIVTLVDNPVVVKDAKDLLYPGLTGIALLSEKNELGADTRKYLTNLGLLDSLNGKIQEAKNERGAMDAVKSGSAGWTFSYKSDAVKAKKLRIIWEVPEKEVTGLEFSAAVVTASKKADKAELFIDLLQSKIAGRIFENAGYRLASEAQTNTGAVALTAQTKPKGSTQTQVSSGATQSQPAAGQEQKKKKKKKKP